MTEPPLSPRVTRRSIFARWGQALTASPDADWLRIGTDWPYQGMTGDPALRDGSPSAEAKAALFASATELITHGLDLATRHFGDLPSRRAALDFGCGIGRMAAALAREFERVTGVDISPDMLREAREVCRAHGADNVDLVLSDDSFHAITGPFDLVWSYAVLQHLPRGRGEATLRRMVEHLRPGGILIVHLNGIAPASPLRRLHRWLRRHVAWLSLAAHLVKRTHPALRVRPMTSYSLDRIVALLLELGVRHVVLEHYVKLGHHMHLVLCQKPIS